VAIDMKGLVAKVVGLFVIFAVALFLPAGTIAWSAAWIFLILFFSFVVALSLWLIRHNPGLMQERMDGLRAADRKAWDKGFLMLMNILFLAWLLVMPLDAVRFHWSRMPAWLQVVGTVALLCSFLIFYLTFRENPYLSPAVRIQTDRGQTVVSTGPYRYVRHPLYSGFALFVLGTALLLGSGYGLLFGLILVGMAATRAVLEERALRDELRGYDAYMTRVRSRLIPHVW
jgi:protein-S-isoprenylcysteine O-methyltransferase Ste14